MGAMLDIAGGIIIGSFVIGILFVGCSLVPKNAIESKMPSVIFILSSVVLGVWIVFLR